MTVHIPNWTKLPPLKLIGAGTSGTESLSSYCLRLTTLCAVPWSSFIALLDAASGSEPGTYNDCSRLSGSGPVVRRRAKTLERLTGQSLLGGTLLGIGELVSGKSATLCKGASWCPRCLVDSVQEDDFPYSRLIWRFAAYSHCATHGARIENTCPHCGSSGFRAVNILVCPGCKGSLTVGARFDPPSRAEKWTNHCVEELIQWTADDPTRVLERSRLLAFVQAVDDVGEAKTQRYRPLKTHREEFVRYMAWRDANVPTLRLRPNIGRVDLGDLLRAAARQCVSVLDMLLRPAECASALLPGVHYSVDIPLGRANLPDAWIAFSKTIEALISDTACLLPSMQELARTCGIRGYDSKCFPGQVARYSAQLRMQRTLYRDVPPHRVNAAFHQSMRQLKEGLTPQQVHGAIQRSLPANSATTRQIVRSASIVYQSMFLLRTP